MSIIIGLSGKKQSGKNTCCSSIFDFIKNRKSQYNFLRVKNDKFICKEFSFAYLLKKIICMDYLGLSEEQCFGSDESKNSFTKYHWGNLPKEINKDNNFFFYEEDNFWNKKFKFLNKLYSRKTKPLRTGNILSKELIYILGSEILLDFFPEKKWDNDTKYEIVSICENVLGLDVEQIFGFTSKMNSPTSYSWEKMPYYIRSKEYDKRLYDSKSFVFDILKETYHKKGKFYNKKIDNLELNKNRYLTSREIMQIVGTDIFRNFFDDNIWVNATLNNIKKDSYPISLISDVRFPSEVNSILKNNGYIIRLTRDPNIGKDMHSSEKSLDDFNWDNNKNIYLLDNKELTLRLQNIELCKIIEKILDKELEQLL